MTNIIVRKLYQRLTATLPKLCFTAASCLIMNTSVVYANNQLQIQPVPEATLEYIKKAAAGDHLALEGGHIALDGHVMPYPYFQPHEVLYLDRLSKLRHNKVWQAKKVKIVDDWQDSYKNKVLLDSELTDSPSKLVGGRHSQTSYFFNIPALPKSESGWERFLVIKPLDMSIIGWPETTIYVEGEAKAAIQRKHFYWSLNTILNDEDQHAVTLKSFGQYDQPRGYREISVSERNPAIDEIYWTLRILIETASIIPKDAKGYPEVRQLIDNVMNQLDLELAGSDLFQKTAENVAQHLTSEFKKIEKLSDSTNVLNVLFHGHLDSAWRWTLEHTDEKIQRLALNNLYLMDRFDEYKYVFTTPYHYERMAKLYPKLYARVQQKIAEGKWIANGSTYVETDLNLPGGESVVRQFLYGLDFYQNELGVEKNTLFLPDTFGFPTYLPQIAQDFGLDHLVAMRTKIANFDHSIYRWKGLDGSEILVNSVTSPAWEYPYIQEVHNHFAGGDLLSTYNAPNSGPRQMAGTWRRFKDKDVSNNQLFLVGWGDGGGGGTEDHIEIAKRVTSLPSLPKVEVTPLYDYMKIQTQKADKFALYDQRIVPPRDWVERTYLMSNGIKMKNRAIENLFRETEALAVQANISGYEYPKSEFKQWWKVLLLNQFHDIITGMAVPEVLMQANQELGELQSTLGALKSKLLTYMAHGAPSKDQSFIVFNGAGVIDSGVVSLGKIKKQGNSLRNLNGELFPVIDLDGQLKVKVAAMPPLSFSLLTWTNDKVKEPNGILSANRRTLENSLIKVKFDKHGQIVSFFDKEQQRELVPPNKVMNQFMTVKHKDIGHGEVATMVNNATYSNYFNNAFSAGFDVSTRINNSTIKQTVSIEPNSKLLNFDTSLNWLEADRLDVNFPLNVNSSEAKHGLQFGHLTMPRTIIRAEDKLLSPTAAFEWADISESGYGVSIFDSTRYGYDLKGDGIRLNLSYGQYKHGYSELKDIKWGVEQSGDAGGQDFKYAIYPHNGTAMDAHVVQHAKAYNAELSMQTISSNSSVSRELSSIISGLPSNIVIESIKQAEKSDATIVRLFEAENRQTRASITLQERVSSVSESKMDESDIQSLNMNGNQVSVTFKPFEIKTLKLSSTK